MRYQLNCIARAADVAWQTLPLEDYQKPTLRVDVPDASRLSTLEHKVLPSDQSRSSTSTEYLRTLVTWAFYLRHAMDFNLSAADWYYSECI